MTHFWRCDILNRADVIDPFYSTWMQGMSYRRYSIIRRSHLFYTITVPLSAHFYFRQDARGAGSQSSRNDTGRAIVNDEIATHVWKLNKYWSTMPATNCMSRWWRWFCQILQYLGCLQCLSYLQRLRCLFKPPLSPLCMYNPIRSTPPSAVNSGQRPAQSQPPENYIWVAKHFGINLDPQGLTSLWWMLQSQNWI